MAYALGSAGKSGASAVGSGMAAVGDAAVGAATSPLRKAGDSMKQSFRDGSRAAIGRTVRHRQCGGDLLRRRKLGLEPRVRITGASRGIQVQHDRWIRRRGA